MSVQHFCRFNCTISMCLFFSFCFCFFKCARRSRVSGNCVDLGRENWHLRDINGRNPLADQTIVFVCGRVYGYEKRFYVSNSPNLLFPIIEFIAKFYLWFDCLKRKNKPIAILKPFFFRTENTFTENHQTKKLNGKL